VGVGGDGYWNSLDGLTAGSDDDGQVFPAAERNECRGDDLAEVAVGNSALRDEDEALGAVELMLPLGQRRLAGRRW
jgi:hypothetical protein